MDCRYVLVDVNLSFHLCLFIAIPYFTCTKYVDMYTVVCIFEWIVKWMHAIPPNAYTSKIIKVNYNFSYRIYLFHVERGLTHDIPVARDRQMWLTLSLPFSSPSPFLSFPLFLSSHPLFPSPSIPSSFFPPIFSLFLFLKTHRSRVEWTKHVNLSLWTEESGKKNPPSRSMQSKLKALEKKIFIIINFEMGSSQY